MGWKIRSRRTRSRATRDAVTLPRRRWRTRPARWPCPGGGRAPRPRGAHVRGRGAAGEVEDEIEIVDHQVEHDGDVGPPGLEGRQPVALQIAGIVQVGPRRAHGAVEALDVPDLERHPAARRRRDQRDPLPPGWRRAAFPSAPRDPALERAESHFGVGRRGHGDRHRLDPAQQARPGRRKRGYRSCRRHARARAESMSWTPTSVASGERGQVPRVVTAQRADADHADAGGAPRHAGTPRSEDSTRSRGTARPRAAAAARSRARSMAWDKLSSELKKSR